MAELSIADLLSALQTTQAAQSTTRLSERNVVELVNKLKQLGILGDDLLYTINGREYITTSRLRSEIKARLAKEGGRLPLVELPALLGVDLVHCERQARALIESDPEGGTVEVQGELLTQQYFDGLAKEVDEMLQESGSVSLADLALQYSLGTEMLSGVLGKRVGSIIQGRQEGGLFYTPAYMRSVKARLRGALRGAASPVVVSGLIKELGLEGTLVSGATLHELVSELCAEGALRGTVKGGGSNWLPAVHAEAQQQAVVAFFRQNGWVGYDTLSKLGIPTSSLKTLIPEGLPLDSVVVAPSLIAQVEAAAEEVASSGSWTDLAPLLPSVLTAGDITALISKVPLLKPGAPGAAAVAAAAAPAAATAATAQAAAGGAAGVAAVAGSCLVSARVMAGLKDAAVTAARQAADKVLKERRGKGAAVGAAVGTAVGAAEEGGEGGRKGKGKGGQAAAGGEEEEEDWGTGKKGGKKGGKGGKAGAGAAAGKPAAGGGGAAGAGAGAAAKREIGLSLDQIRGLVLGLYPDMEGAGDDSDAGGGGGGWGLAGVIAAMVMPACVAAYEEGLTAALTAGAEARRARRDALGARFESVYRRLALYCGGAAALAAAVGGGGTAAAAVGGGKEAAGAAGAAGGRGGKAGGKGAAREEAGVGAGAGAGAGGKEGDSLHTTVVRHVVRTIGNECLDLLHRWARAEYLPGEEDQDASSPAAPEGAGVGGSVGGGVGGGVEPPLSASERNKIIKGVPADVGSALAAATDALNAPEGPSLTALEQAAGVVGLRLRRLDKKAEAKESKAAVAEVQQRLEAALAAESDPAAALTLVVPLLFIRATGRTITLPGKAMSGVLTFLRPHLPESDLQQVEAFHTLVVEHLKEQSSGGGGGASPTAQQLAERLPIVKALATKAAGGDDAGPGGDVEGEKAE